MFNSRSLDFKFASIKWLLLATCIIVICQKYSSSDAAELQNTNAPASNNDFRYPHFDSKSFWYQPVPTDAVLNPNSAGLTTEFVRQIRTYYGRVGINTADYSSPLYVADSQVPQTSVRVSDCFHSGTINAKLSHDFARVPIPPYATPAGGTDSEMAIYEPSSDTLWEFWQIHKVGDVWSACWGGKMQSVSKNLGIWPSPYGASATGLPFTVGQIQIDELRKGAIGHVMGIAVVDAGKGRFSWPANRADGKAAVSGSTILEGMRMRLDPSIDLDSLNLNPFAKTVAKAAQKYGFVVWDVAGSVSLRAENPKRYTLVGLPDPYRTLAGYNPYYNALDGIPWERMQFLPLDYGRKSSGDQ